MKKILFLIALVFAFASCTTYKTYSEGKEDQSYIIVVSQSKPYKDVTVKVDNQTTLLKKVKKTNRVMTSQQIIIKPGQHNVEVTHNGKTLYSQKIFVGVQETKKITLE